MTIDDISSAIGALKEAATQSQRQRQELFRQLERLNKSVACLPELVKRLEKHDKDIEALQAAKNRGLGALAVIGTGGGVIGALLTKLGLGE